MGECRQVLFSTDLLAEVVTALEKFPAATRHRIRVLLPHRRACRRLREMLLQRGGAQLLPRIMPLGEPDIAEFALPTEVGSAFPEVSPLLRTLLFTRLLAAARVQDGILGSLEQDFIQAESLGSTLDRLQEFDADLSSLHAPEHPDYAGHWARAAVLIDVVKAFWPAWCHEHQSLDRVAKRNIALRQLAENLGDAPIIIAGSSGRAYAVRDLMHAVLQHQAGLVFLQGTELLSEGELTKIAQAPTHPGHALARLWQALALPESDILGHESGSMGFYRAGFRLTGQKMLPSEKPSNIQGLVLPDRQDEVATVALLAREAFAKNDQAKVAVIASDESFAVSLERWLLRWNIALDRAAGIALIHTAVGRLVVLLLEILREGLDMVRLLAFLKHPLVLLGGTRQEVWQTITRLEKHFLEDGYDEVVYQEIVQHRRDFPHLEMLSLLFEKIENQKFIELLRIFTVLLGDCVKSTDTAMPDDPAWHSIQEFFHEFTIAAELADFPETSPQDFARIMLVQLGKLRVASGIRASHRVMLLSTMEARLMRFDRVIIPMMHHGSVPSNPPAEPWMTRPQYRECAIPEPEEVIGLAAHDFIELCHQQEVYLLRAEKTGDEVVAASSWWDRLDTVARYSGTEGLVSREQNAIWRARVAALTRASHNPSHGQPRPKPALEWRPQTLSVTQVSKLFRNPYEIYTDKILKLKCIPLRRSDSYSLRRGTLYHTLVQEFVEKQIVNVRQPETWLVERGREKIRDFRAFEQLDLYYQLRRLAHHFVRLEREFHGRTSIVECKGEWAIAGMKVKGIADRIIHNDNELILWDYKTGQPPSRTAVVDGYEWQLPILALMVKAGAFQPKIAGEILKMGYWKIGGSKNDKQYGIFSDKDIPDNMREILQNIQELVTSKLRDWQSPDTVFAAYPYPDNLPQYCAVDHLIRAQEWLKFFILESEDGE